MHSPKLVAALKDQLASALLADLARPRGRPLAVEAAQLPEQLHAPFPVKIVPTAAFQEVHWGAQSPFQPQADQKGYPPVTQTTVCAGRGVVTHAVSCDANCQILPESTTLDAVPAAAADALLLAAAAADTQLHADAAAGVQLRAVAVAVAAAAGGYKRVHSPGLLAWLPRFVDRAAGGTWLLSARAKQIVGR